MSVFGTLAQQLELTVQRLEEDRDRRNGRARFNYEAEFATWILNRKFQPTPPDLPGTWVIVSTPYTINGVEYIVPNDALVYREDVPLGEPLEAPTPPAVTGPQIGEPIYADDPLGARHIASGGRAKLSDNGTKHKITINGQEVEYVLNVRSSIPPTVSAWWVPVVPGV